MKKIIAFVTAALVTSSMLSQSDYETLFYMIDSPSSFNSFMDNADHISIVCPQTFNISEHGVIYGSVDRRILKTAKEKGIKVMPLIVNKGFNQELLHKILTNPDARRRSINMMLEYAEKYDLDGWQFDLEGLHLSDNENYTQYFREAASALHKNNLMISAALVHMLEDVGGTSEYHLYLYENWRAGFEINTIANLSDFITIMTYDQHTLRTPPGPVAGKKWVDQVVSYLLGKGVEPEKLSLGVPSYSVHWYADYSESRGGFQNGRQISYSMVEHLLEQNDAMTSWHEEAGCNYSFWEKDGTFEYLFIEDGESLKPKLNILEKYNLRGISVWRLGTEAPGFWDTMESHLK